MIRLFASDLDGTLLNEHHECDEKIEKGIQKIIDAGKIFTVATGRGIKMVNLKKAGDISYYICLNGAAVLDPKKQLLHCEPIDKEVLSKIMDVFEDLNLEYVSWNKVYSRIDKESVLRYRKNVWKEAANDSWLDRFLNNIIVNFECLQSKEEILQKDICKINYHFSDDTDTSRLDDFLKQYDDKLVNAPSGDGIYEITKNGVNKASAVSWLADFLNISKEEVAVYGDGGNDIMMLSSFKHSYTPSTGSIEAKEATSQIIGPYEDYSVIEHILNTIEEEKKIE